MEPGVRHSAIMALGKEYFDEALPMFKRMVGDLKKDETIHEDLYYFIHENGLYKLFADQFYGIIADYRAYADFIEICRRIVREFGHQLMRLAALLYLYDNDEIDDKEFTAAFGSSRSEFPRFDDPLDYLTYMEGLSLYITE